MGVMPIVFTESKKSYHAPKPWLVAEYQGVLLEVHPNYGAQPGWIAKASLSGAHSMPGFEADVVDQPTAERRAKEMAREIIEKEIVWLMNLREELKP
jgi:hypothetical protein